MFLTSLGSFGWKNKQIRDVVEGIIIRLFNSQNNKLLPIFTFGKDGSNQTLSSFRRLVLLLIGLVFIQTTFLIKQVDISLKQNVPK